MTLLRVLGLCHAYGRRTALAGIDLVVRSGERIGIMGPNGSGKSTLVRSLAGVLRPSDGSIDRRIPDRAVAVVPDEVPFAEALSGAENVRRMLTLRRVPYARTAGPTARRLADLGLADRAADRVATYSTGMRRRLALAEAFAAEPRLLLLDEPTMGLDVEGRSALAGLLSEAASGGCAVVLASNDPAFVARACERVVFLLEGRVVAEGEPGQLIRALGHRAAIEVALEVPRAESAERLPPGISLLAAPSGGLRFSADRGTADLPALCAWLIGRGHSVRSIRVREPDLADVFLSLTGVRLHPDPGPLDGAA